MRKIQTSDVFNAMRLIKKANLKEEVKPILKRIATGEFNIEDAGIEGIISFVEILSEKKSEQAIYEVLGGPFEMEAKEIERMDLNDFAETLEQLGKDNDLKRFFTLLAGLIGKK